MERAGKRGFVRNWSVGYDKRAPAFGSCIAVFIDSFSGIGPRVNAQAIADARKQSLTVRACGRLLNRFLPPRRDRKSGSNLNRSSSNPLGVSSVINAILWPGLSLIAFNHNLFSAPIN